MKEGGKDSEAAVAAAKRYAANAMKLGGAMLKWNPMTERTDIFYVETGKRQLFSQMWSKTKSQRQEISSTTDAGGPPRKTRRVETPQPFFKNDGGNEDEDEDEVAPPVNPMSRAKAQAKVKAKAKAGAGKPGTPDDKAHMAKALRTRRLYHEVVGTAANLLKTIDEKLEWSWARNQNREKLAESVQALSADMPKFVSDFLVVDLAALKPEMAADQLAVEIQKVPQMLDEKIEAVLKQVKRLGRMHTISKGF